MRLFEHPDFEQAILRAQEHVRSRGLRPAIIEKDYYSYARHYYDLYQLADEAEVRAMLQSPEYATIKADYDRISRTHFSRDYSHPEDMSFAKSDALFPPEDLARLIADEYERQCRALCYGPFPSWDKVQARFNQLRPLL